MKEQVTLVCEKCNTPISKGDINKSIQDNMLILTYDCPTVGCGLKYTKSVNLINGWSNTKSS